ncbi:MAG TPA: tryptophanase leader peptide [Verrucomicrobiales bacterium]|nr:tryptophanase leader peptide [Verrucomicrobiales bacterium]
MLTSSNLTAWFNVDSR